LEAAILNLAVNARDAMTAGGALTIATQRRRLSPTPAADARDYVVVTATDSGEGISPENISRVFDPFFTTKPIGKGSGLGLSQVHGFVNQLGGHVLVDSTVGVGTTISLCLPAAAVAETTTGTISDAPAPATVLVVDDEPAVLEIAVAMLGTLNYRVLTATDAWSALRVLSRERDVDMLLTDVAMPNGMNGIELAEKALGLDARLKVLLISGYPTGTKLQAHPFPLLKKPYTRAQLGERLRELLVRD
jgi:CheY-like chemotaxis protein